MTDFAEHPLPPRPRTWSFYFVFLAITVLWCPIPLSWVLVIYSLHSGKIWTYSWPELSLFTAALCEVFFSVYHFHLARHVAGLTPCGPADPIEIQAAFIRLLKAGLAQLPGDGGDHESLVVERPGSPEEAIIQLERDDPRAIEFRHCLRTWFCKTPWSDIRLHDIQRWLYWSLYNAEMPPHEKIPPSYRVAIDGAVELLQKRLGCKLEDGSNPNIRCMRLTIDPVQIIARPFFFYGSIKLVNTSLRYWYKTKWGARYGCHDELEYLLRIPPHWDHASSPRPLVFAHGLGLGLVQYHILLSHMFEAVPDRPILILLQPQISQDFFHPHFLKPLNRHQMAEKVVSLLKKLGWADIEFGDEQFDSEDEQEVAKLLNRNRKKGVTFLSHSNGSYVHAWMLKVHPKLVARSCFVDPVTFCSWEGDVCYNFLYRTPMTGIEILMKYFVGTELGVANLLQRHFDWVSNSLWYEEIPNARDPSKTLFLLGGRDDIVNSERVKRYLTSHGIRKNLWYDPNGKHGQALMTGGRGNTEIFRWLHEPEL